MSADLGNLALKLSADPSQMTSGLSATIASVQKFGNNVISIMDSVSATIETNPIGFAITNALKALQLFAAASVGVAGELASLNKEGQAAIGFQAGLARKFGLSAEEASGFSLAIKKAGVDSGEASDALRGLQKHIGEAAIKGGEAAETYARFGLDAQELAKMQPTEALQAVSKALSQIAPGTERVAAGYELLGRHGQALLPIAGYLSDAAEQAKRWGIATTETENSMVKAATVAMRQAGVAVDSIRQSFANRFAVLFAPLEEGFSKIILKMVESAEPFLGWLREKISGLQPLAEAIVAGVSKAWERMEPAFAKIWQYVMDFSEEFFGTLGTMDDWSDTLEMISDIIASGLLWGLKVGVEFFADMLNIAVSLFGWAKKLVDLWMNWTPVGWLLKALKYWYGDEEGFQATPSKKAPKEKKEKEPGDFLDISKGIKEKDTKEAREAKQREQHYSAPEALTAGSAAAIDAINRSMFGGDKDDVAKETLDVARQQKAAIDAGILVQQGIRDALQVAPEALAPGSAAAIDAINRSMFGGDKDDTAKETLDVAKQQKAAIDASILVQQGIRDALQVAMGQAVCIP